jgi:hypothetical protein
MAREIGDILEVLPYPALLVKPAVAAAPDYLARPLAMRGVCRNVHRGMGKRQGKAGQSLMGSEIRITCRHSISIILLLLYG